MNNINQLGEKQKITLDSFLTMTYKKILQGSWNVLHEKAYEEYEKYMKKHLTQVANDYLKIMCEDIKN